MPLGPLAGSSALIDFAEGLITHIREMSDPLRPSSTDFSARVEMVSIDEAYL